MPLNGLLLVGGIAHGAFACGGTTLAIYGQYTLPKKDVFRATLSAMWVVLGAVLITNSISRGMWTKRVETLVLIGVPLELLASWLGQRMAERIDANAFVRLVSGLLVLSGILTCASVFVII